MIITTTTTPTGIATAIPYEAENVRAAIKARLGGRWDAASRRWVVPAAAAAQLRELLVAEFGGVDATRPGGAQVVLRATQDTHRTCSGVHGLGRVLVAASGRDSGARAGEGVIIEAGRPRSAGSARYWTTVVPEGTVLRVLDVDLDRVARDDSGNILPPDGFEVVEVVEPSTPAVDPEVAAAAETLRARFSSAQLQQLAALLQA